MRSLDKGENEKWVNWWGKIISVVWHKTVESINLVWSIYVCTNTVVPYQLSKPVHKNEERGLILKHCNTHISNIPAL